MKLKLIFRQAIKADADAIAQLHAEVYGQPECIESLREKWQKYTNGRGGKSVHVCFHPEKKEIIGAIFSRPKKPGKKKRFLEKTKQQNREIVDLFVHPDFQYKRSREKNPKIGRRLLKENLETSDRMNAITTVSVPSCHAAARHLFATVGFRVVPQKKPKPKTLIMLRGEKLEL